MRTVAAIGGVATALVTTLATWSAPAKAADPAQDAAKLYDLQMEASPKVAQGKEGKVTVRITPKAGAEIHKEAPISLSLAGKGVSPGKPKYGRTDMQMQGTEATFDVPFTATAKGKGALDATLTFFICTEKVCARQERKQTLPVQVD